jgi:hypothetical protein
MGLLNYIEGLLPKPSEAEIEKMRRSIQKQKNAPSGFGGLLGMLGPSDAEKAQLRQQRGLPQAEEPSPWVSVGRGVTDLWEPVKQVYLDANVPALAQAYRLQRAEDERLYQQGMQWANPQPGYVPARDDFWRMQGHQVPLLIGSVIAPPMSAPEYMIGAGATQNLYTGIDTLRKRFGIGE